MRKLVTFLILAAVVALGLLVARGPAAPALPDKPAKWEYAELQYGREARAAAGFGGGGGPGGAGFPGFPGGGAAGGGGPAPVAAGPLVHWFTADEEIEAADWKALADKLKAPAAKNDGSQTVHRLRVLNRLSADGWEIYERTGTYNWTFRRKVQ